MKRISIEGETIESVEATITSDADPTGDVVAWAFPTTGSRPSSFTAGTWDGVATLVGSTYQTVTASPTIGASGASVELVAGTYDAYVKITDSPEVPVIKAGTILVK